MKRDYYEVLGVSKTADADAIKKAYRKLAKKYHPDAHPGDKECEKKFQEVSEAYAVLSDPEKKQAYDTYGFAAFDGGAGGGAGAGGYGGGGFHFDGKDAEDLFRNMFGDMFGGFGGGGRSYSTGGFGGFGGFGGRGASGFGGSGYEEQLDVHSELTISFDEAVQGCTKTIRLASQTGGAPSSLQVKIPAGIEEGKSIRLRGRGRQGRSRTGDLMLKIHVGSRPGFERKGQDIYTTAQIPYTTAALGGEAQIQTLSGSVMCNIPAGTQSGSKIRLKGKGVVSMRQAGVYGDQYVTIEIQVPRHLTAEQKTKLEEFRALLG